MELHEWQYLSKEEKEEINKFIETNIETIYDKREAYGASIDLTKNILTVVNRKDIKNEFVEDRFVGYWCNICQDWVELDSDVGMINHVIGHLHPIKEESGDQDEQNSQNLAT